ncbi:hypothetical protein [Streptomyces decoyicus]|uniref:hypothetical protein n=1 Tax=Streptomyces decoyicus TaxID=249567 RepID=UPI0038033F6A
MCSHPATWPDRGATGRARAEKRREVTVSGVVVRYYVSNAVLTVTVVRVIYV